MKDELQGNEPAMPVNYVKSDEGCIYNSKDDNLAGLSIRQYACIHLGLPETGVEWLDKLIAKKQRQSIAEKAMQGMLANAHFEYDDKEPVKYADDLLSELNKPTT